MTGADLRRMREAKGWSQHYLGVMSGVQQQSISNYEAGKTYIYKSTMKKLLDALNSEDPNPPNIDKDGIGKICHEKRMMKGLSVKDLTFRAGVDEITVVRLENGEFVPTQKTVDMIMEVFDYDRIEDHPSMMDNIACNDLAQAIIVGALHDLRGLMIWDYGRIVQKDIKGQIKPRSDCNYREIANFFRSDFFSMMCPNMDGIKMMHEYKEKCRREIPELPRIKVYYKGFKVHQSFNNNVSIYDKSKYGKLVYHVILNEKLTEDQLKEYVNQYLSLRDNKSLEEIFREEDK